MRRQTRFATPLPFPRRIRAVLRRVLSGALGVLFLAARALPAQVHSSAGSVTREMVIDGNRLGLSTINAIAVSDRGTIAIGQPEESRVLFFDAAGHALGGFGREGEGPGEFRTLGSFSWLGDSLYVPAPRLTIISPALKLLREQPWDDIVHFPAGATPAFALLGRPLPLRIYSDGSRLVRGIINTAKSGEPFAPAMVYLRISSANRVTGAVAGLPPENVPGFIGLMAIQTRVAIDPTGGRIVIATSPEIRSGSPTHRRWRLQVVDSTGRSLLSRGYSYRPVPIPQRVRDSLAHPPAPPPSNPAILHVTPPPPMVAPLAGGTGRNAGPQQLIPEYLPPIRHVLAGRDGTIWLERWTLDPAPRWDVLDDRGDSLMTVTLPVGADLRVADRQHIWVIERDADDVPSVVRYRLRPH